MNTKLISIVAALLLGVAGCGGSGGGGGGQPPPPPPPPITTAEAYQFLAFLHEGFPSWADEYALAHASLNWSADYADLDFAKDPLIAPLVEAMNYSQNRPFAPQYEQFRQGYFCPGLQVSLLDFADNGKHVFDRSYDGAVEQFVEHAQGDKKDKEKNQTEYQNTRAVFPGRNGHRVQLPLERHQRYHQDGHRDQASESIVEADSFRDRITSDAIDICEPALGEK